MNNSRDGMKTKNIRNILSQKITKRFTIKKTYKRFSFNKHTVLRKIISFYKYIIIIVVIFIIYSLFLQNIIFINKDDKIISNLINTDRSYTNESLDDTIDKAKNFVNLTNREVLLHEIPKNKIKSPKISVVIPVYNAQRFIRRTVRSAQNQNMAELEIVLVNDVSKDSSLQKMEELAKEDHRIKIIRNEKNMGTLYSRCIGALLSKGKYVIPLDNDDMFLNNDVFDVVYDDIEKSKIEITNFRAITLWNIEDFFVKKHLSLWRSHRCNYIMYQPKLGIYGHKRCNLWTQCIKTEVYKNAINLYGEERMKNYVNFFEDCIMTNIIYQVANSAKLLLKVGILHIDRDFSSSHHENKFNKAKFRMFYLESQYEFSKYATEKKDTVLMELNGLIRRGRFQVVLKEEKIRIYLKNLIKRIYRDKDVLNITKEILLNTSRDINIINNTKEIF